MVLRGGHTTPVSFRNISQHDRVSPMRSRLGKFAVYVDLLEDLAATPRSPSEQLRIHLDGEPNRQLRGAIDVDYRRTLGAFFTGESLARRLLASVPKDVTGYVDPACGAGDLLLAASCRLEVATTLKETLVRWNAQLAGYDVQPEFVRATRARIALAAIARGALHTEEIDLSKVLSSVVVGDALEFSPSAGQAVLLNPPFGRVVAPKDCGWTSGLTTAAALFTDRLLEVTPAGNYFAAILPDVLRSGSRYGAFRDVTARRLDIRRIQPIGLFDQATDVDVFVLAGRLGAATSTSSRWTTPVRGRTLADLCEVRVGPVVANRDPKKGPWRRFVAAKDASAAHQLWPQKNRRFKGTVFMPPFVVVGRTNRPTSASQQRLRATIVRGKLPVAVENHMLVLVPHEPTLARCRELVRVLHSTRTTRYLNSRLRCRHMTVLALRDVPL